MGKKTDRQKFNLRSFTGFSLVISTIIMSWSGFILYVAPPGRIANWGTWRLMLFTKAEWQALHTIFSYLFFILFIIHLFFVNWKAFLTYFRSKVRAGLNRKWELASAVILSTVVFIGTLDYWTPFGPVMVFGDKVRESWGNKIETPPVVHMEDYTLDSLSASFGGIPSDELMKQLIDKDVKVEGTDISLEIIARENNTTPAAIYKILESIYSPSGKGTGGREGTGGGGNPSGYGRYTIKSIAESSGREPSALLLKLKEQGIEADENTTVRAIADRMGITPKEVYDMLTED